MWYSVFPLVRFPFKGGIPGARPSLDPNTFEAAWHHRVHNVAWSRTPLHYVSISSVASLKELSALSSGVDGLSRSDRSNAGRGVLQNWKELNASSLSSLSSGRVTWNGTGIVELMRREIVNSQHHWKPTWSWLFRALLFTSFISFSIRRRRHRY